MSQSTFLDYVPSAIQGDADSVAAPGLVGAGGTLYQSIRKSSSRALLVGDLSGVSVHLNPGGAGGACGDGAAGSLNRASEIPSLTPALIAEYSTQYVSSIPMAAAMNGNSSPSPINPMVASPSFEAADLKSAPGRVGAGGTFQGKRSRFFLISLLISSPAAMTANASMTSSPVIANCSISSKTHLLVVELIVAGSLLLLALNILALVVFWCFVRPLLERRS